MKIGIFFGTFAGGGAERMMINLAKGLHDSGTEVTIYVVNKTGPLLKEVPSYINIHDYQSKYGVKSVILKIRNSLVHDNLDALISTQEHINSSVAIASIGSGTKTKIIFREANTPKQKKNALWRKLLYRQLYFLADHHVAVSEGVKHDMKEFYQLNDSDISVIYNPVVTGSLPSLANEEVDHPWFTGTKTTPVIVAAGRFQPQKGFEDLIKAFALVRKQREAKLVIFGDYTKNSTYFNELQNDVHHYNLQDDVDFPGFVDNPFKFFSRASVFVLSSLHEGLPGVLIQAMACGCPVVSTDCPSGPREILNHGQYGRLTPVSDPVKLAEAITKNLKQKHNVTELVNRANKFKVSLAVDSYLELTNKLKDVEKVS